MTQRTAKRNHSISHILVNSFEYFQKTPDIPEISLKGIDLQLFQLDKLFLLKNPTEIDDSNDPHSCQLLLTPTVKTVVSQIEQCLFHSRPFILFGPPGSGKSSVLQWIIHSLNKSDSAMIVNGSTNLDIKTLVGVQIATKEPGEFLWTPGILTKAVTKGLVLVIEDFDLASGPIWSLFTGVLVLKQLETPFGNIPVHPNFQLVFTQTLDVDIYPPPPSPTLLQLVSECQTIHMAQPSFQEQKDILKLLFPSIPFVDQILRMYHRLRKINNLSFNQSEFEFHHIVRYCKRLSHRKLSTKTLTTVDYLDAVDVFSGFSSNPSLLWDALFADVDKTTQTNCTINYIPDLTRSTPSKIPFILNYDIIKTNVAPTTFTLSFLEKLLRVVHHGESGLFCGPTGVGKTFLVDTLALSLGKKLYAVNMSSETETTDLIGRFEPWTIDSLLERVYSEFQSLFTSCFSEARNAQFLRVVDSVYQQKNWKMFFSILSTVFFPKMFKELGIENDLDSLSLKGKSFSPPPSQRRKSNNGAIAPKKIVYKSSKFESTDSSIPPRVDDSVNVVERWKAFHSLVEKSQTLWKTHQKKKSAFFFHFRMGPLAQAWINGDWILIDEINLASNQVLQLLASVLSKTLVLTERGDTKPIPMHPDFRFFACMNPGDVGKKCLPRALMSHLTEFWYGKLTDPHQLKTLTTWVLGNYTNDETILSCVQLFLSFLQHSESGALVDSMKHAPNYALRIYLRALRYATRNSNIYGLVRSLYNGFLMTFCPSLNASSWDVAHSLILNAFSISPSQLVTWSKQKPWIKNAPKLTGSLTYMIMEHYLISCDESKIQSDPEFILTNHIRKSLKDLVRVVGGSQHPILLQGPTSAGKTSLINYLGKCSGHKVVRINNHEHTSVDEYLGTYRPTESGFEFVPGLLYNAVKYGFWIILDELNLASSSILEILNRLLDDNLQLFVPETCETIHAHPEFRLFGTQNPPGIYSGRKTLSRAFRNRFIEIHFDTIPAPDLIEIVHKRCAVPESTAKLMVQFFHQLGIHRRNQNVFDAESSFMTLRDLFRWSLRPLDPSIQLEAYKRAQTAFQSIAVKFRESSDMSTFASLVHSIFTPRFEGKLTPKIPAKCVLDNFNPKFCITPKLRYLVGCIESALVVRDPILLVGPTGSGKTFLVQQLASRANKKLVIINVHQNTEGSDFLGAMRPVRNHDLTSRSNEDGVVGGVVGGVGTTLSSSSSSSSSNPALISSASPTASQPSPSKLFSWNDGPLVQAVKNGWWFLIDEISLAEDSVLERLNSVLERKPLLTLAETGEEIIIHPEFRILATMNPTGDYGKRELSPALRNRFCEMWVPCSVEFIHLFSSHCPFLSFELKTNLSSSLEKLGAFGLVISLRTITDMCNIISVFHKNNLEINLSVSISLVFCILDGIGVGTNLVEFNLSPLGLSNVDTTSSPKDIVISFLKKQNLLSIDIEKPLLPCSITEKAIILGPWTFDIVDSSVLDKFCFDSPTTCSNLVRVLLGIKTGQHILLEGPVGVGKTALVQNLGQLFGKVVGRLNCSEHSELIDFLGCDRPVHKNGIQTFDWVEGVLMRAVVRGQWILMDEMNLATQSVLEGLNSLLDHRGSCYLPDLGKTIVKHPNFRFFACQNPLSDGAGRRGLPASFLNRFVKVAVNSLSSKDFSFIGKKILSRSSQKLFPKALHLNQEMQNNSPLGGPFTLNLRDLVRLDSFVANEKNFDYLASLSMIRQFQTLKDMNLAISTLELSDNIHDGVLHLDPEYISTGIGKFPRKLAPVNMINNLTPIFRLGSQFIPLMNDLSAILENRHFPMLVFDSFANQKHISQLIYYVCSLYSRKCSQIWCTKDLEASDLLGQWHQHVSFNVDAMAESKFPLIDSLENLLGTFPKESLIEQDGSTDFTESTESNSTEADSGWLKWFDGPLTQAILKGHVFVLNSANLVSPAVLDRFNNLFENETHFYLLESGLARSIPIHPEFRLILICNTNYPPLSPAMRNRCIEIFVSDSLFGDLNSKSDSIVSDSPVSTLTFTQTNNNFYSSTWIDWETSLTSNHNIWCHFSALQNSSQFFSWMLCFQSILKYQLQPHHFGIEINQSKSLLKHWWNHSLTHSDESPFLFSLVSILNPIQNLYVFSNMNQKTNQKTNQLSPTIVYLKDMFSHIYCLTTSISNHFNSLTYDSFQLFVWYIWFYYYLFKNTHQFDPQIFFATVERIMTMDSQNQLLLNMYKACHGDYQVDTDFDPIILKKIVSVKHFINHEEFEQTQLFYDSVFAKDDIVPSREKYWLIDGLKSFLNGSPPRFALLAKHPNISFKMPMCTPNGNLFSIPSCDSLDLFQSSTFGQLACNYPKYATQLFSAIPSFRIVDLGLVESYSIPALYLSKCPQYSIQQISNHLCNSLQIGSLLKALNLAKFHFLHYLVDSNDAMQQLIVLFSELLGDVGDVGDVGYQADHSNIADITDLGTIDGQNQPKQNKKASLILLNLAKRLFMKLSLFGLVDPFAKDTNQSAILTQLESFVQKGIGCFSRAQSFWYHQDTIKFKSWTIDFMDQLAKEKSTLKCIYRPMCTEKSTVNHPLFRSQNSKSFEQLGQLIQNAKKTLLKQSFIDPLSFLNFSKQLDSFCPLFFDVVAPFKIISLLISVLATQIEQKPSPFNETSLELWIDTLLFAKVPVKPLVAVESLFKTQSNTNSSFDDLFFHLGRLSAEYRKWKSAVDPGWTYVKRSSELDSVKSLIDVEKYREFLDPETLEKYSRNEDEQVEEKDSAHRQPHRKQQGFYECIPVILRLVFLKLSNHISDPCGHFLPHCINVYNQINSINVLGAKNTTICWLDLFSNLSQFALRTTQLLSQFPCHPRLLVILDCVNNLLCHPVAHYSNYKRNTTADRKSLIASIDILIQLAAPWERDHLSTHPHLAFHYWIQAIEKNCLTLLDQSSVYEWKSTLLENNDRFQSKASLVLFQILSPVKPDGPSVSITTFSKLFLQYLKTSPIGMFETLYQWARCFSPKKLFPILQGFSWTRKHIKKYLDTTQKEPVNEFKKQLTLVQFKGSATLKKTRHQLDQLVGKIQSIYATPFSQWIDLWKASQSLDEKMFLKRDIGGLHGSGRSGASATSATSATTATTAAKSPFRSLVTLYTGLADTQSEFYSKKKILLIQATKIKSLCGLDCESPLSFTSLQQSLNHEMSAILSKKPESDQDPKSFNKQLVMEKRLMLGSWLKMFSRQGFFKTSLLRHSFPDISSILNYTQFEPIIEPPLIPDSISSSGLISGVIAFNTLCQTNITKSLDTLWGATTLWSHYMNIPHHKSVTKPQQRQIKSVVSQLLVGCLKQTGYIIKAYNSLSRQIFSTCIILSKAQFSFSKESLIYFKSYMSRFMESCTLVEKGLEFEPVLKRNGCHTCSPKSVSPITPWFVPSPESHGTTFQTSQTNHQTTVVHDRWFGYDMFDNDDPLFLPTFSQGHIQLAKSDIENFKSRVKRCKIILEKLQICFSQLLHFDGKCYSADNATMSSLVAQLSEEINFPFYHNHFVPICGSWNLTIGGKDLDMDSHQTDQSISSSNQSVLDNSLGKSSFSNKSSPDDSLEKAFIFSFLKPKALLTQSSNTTRSPTYFEFNHIRTLNLCQALSLFGSKLDTNDLQPLYFHNTLFSAGLLRCQEFNSSTIEFLFTILPIASAIAKDGFCSLDPQDNQDPGQDSVMTDGTGLGEGEGSNDISDTLEDKDIEDILEQMGNDTENKPSDGKSKDVDDFNIEDDLEFDADTEDADPEDSNDQDEQKDQDLQDELDNAFDPKGNSFDYKEWSHQDDQAKDDIDQEKNENDEFDQQDPEIEPEFDEKDDQDMEKNQDNLEKNGEEQSEQNPEPQPSQEPENSAQDTTEMQEFADDNTSSMMSTLEDQHELSDIDETQDQDPQDAGENEPEDDLNLDDLEIPDQTLMDLEEDQEGDGDGDQDQDGINDDLPDQGELEEPGMAEPTEHPDEEQFDEENEKPSIVQDSSDLTNEQGETGTSSSSIQDQQENQESESSNSVTSDEQDASLGNNSTNQDQSNSELSNDQSEQSEKETWDSDQNQHNQQQITTEQEWKKRQQQILQDISKLSQHEAETNQTPDQEQEQEQEYGVSKDSNQMVNVGDDDDAEDDIVFVDDAEDEQSGQEIEGFYDQEDQMESQDKDLNANLNEDNQDSDEDNQNIENPINTPVSMNTDPDALLNDSDQDIGENALLQSWAEIDRCTAQASRILCEHFRLILAPTKRTKMNPGYSSGKRLNMRAIIPYIASNFRRDKIWLRRTKPADRTYQIVIAIDDSQSMQHYNAGNAARNSMITLIKSLAQLEAGDIGVISFGNSARVVHPLNVNFIPSIHGPQLVKEIQFQQKSTDMLKCLETIQETFESVAHQSETFQLCFIISDGRFSNRSDQVRKQIQQATENGQLVVFIILDITMEGENTWTSSSQNPSNPQQNSQKSIYQLQSVEWDGTEMKISSYLESFPFDYFIVVQDLEKLPVTLSEIVKSWFSAVAEL